MWASRTLARNSILGDGSSLVAQRLLTFLRQPSAFRADHAIRTLPWAPLASSRRVQTGCLSWTRASSSHGSLSKQWATKVRSEGRPCGKSSKRVQTGEPSHRFRSSRYPIDFTAGLRRPPSNSWRQSCNPSMDSNRHGPNGLSNRLSRCLPMMRSSPDAAHSAPAFYSRHAWAESGLRG
jgi:hypothetical protein